MRCQVRVRSCVGDNPRPQLGRRVIERVVKGICASMGLDNSSQLRDRAVMGSGSGVQISCAEGSSTRSRIVTWRGRVSM